MSPRVSLGAPAVVRAVDVLAAITDHGPLTVTELAAQVGLQKSSIADITGTLYGEDVLVRSADGRYALGPAFESLVADAAGEARIYDLFDSAVAGENALEGLTLSLHMLYGSEATCIAVRLGSHPLTSTPRPGQRSTADSAIVRAILQQAPQERVNAMHQAFAAHEGLNGETSRGKSNAPSRTASAAHWEESGSFGILVAIGIPSTGPAALPCAIAVHFREEDRSTLAREAEAGVLSVAATIGRAKLATSRSTH